MELAVDEVRIPMEEGGRAGKRGRVGHILKTNDFKSCSPAGGSRLQDSEGKGSLPLALRPR